MRGKSVFAGTTINLALVRRRERVRTVREIDKLGRMCGEVTAHFRFVRLNPASVNRCQLGASVFNGEHLQLGHYVPPRNATNIEVLIPMVVLLWARNAEALAAGSATYVGLAPSAANPITHRFLASCHVRRNVRKFPLGQGRRAPVYSRLRFKPYAGSAEAAGQPRRRDC